MSRVRERVEKHPIGHVVDPGNASKPWHGHPDGQDHRRARDVKETRFVSRLSPRRAASVNVVPREPAPRAKLKPLSIAHRALGWSVAPEGAKIAVICAGSFGTGLAAALVRGGRRATLWNKTEGVVNDINGNHHNAKHLKGVSLPKSLVATSDIAHAVAGAQIIVLTVPSNALREVLSQVVAHAPKNAIIVSGMKGLDIATLQLPSEIIRESWPGPTAALSGPSFGEELGRNKRTTVAVASRDAEIAEILRRALTTRSLTIRASTDVAATEIGGVLKNVYALALGTAKDRGEATAAAWHGEALKEMTEFAKALGGDPRSVLGVAVAGDFKLSSAEGSRNYRTGVAIGRGEKTADEVKSANGVVEGVRAAKAAFILAQRLGLDLPLLRHVYEVLYAGKPPQAEVNLPPAALPVNVQGLELNALREVYAYAFATAKAHGENLAGAWHSEALEEIGQLTHALGGDRLSVLSGAGASDFNHRPGGLTLGRQQEAVRRAAGAAYGLSLRLRLKLPLLRHIYEILCHGKPDLPDSGPRHPLSWYRRRPG